MWREVHTDCGTKRECSVIARILVWHVEPELPTDENVDWYTLLSIVQTRKAMRLDQMQMRYKCSCMQQVTDVEALRGEAIRQWRSYMRRYPTQNKVSKT